MISHLTEKERIRISLKLYDKDKNLWRKFEAMEDRYKQAESNNSRAIIDWDLFEI